MFKYLIRLDFMLDGFRFEIEKPWSSRAQISMGDELLIYPFHNALEVSVVQWAVEATEYDAYILCMSPALIGRVCEWPELSKAFPSLNDDEAWKKLSSGSAAVEPADTCEALS